MSSSEREIRDRIAQNDVTIGRSYLEVDVMEWFSDNEIPFAYEAFVIPSVVGPSQNKWNRISNAIRALGRGDEDGYNNSVRGTPIEDVSAFEARTIWGDIYEKHRLGQEDVFVPPQSALSEFQKTMVLPDFALYLDVDFRNAPDGFDYSTYDYIVEVSGLWGVGLPGEASEQEWWDWYRVSAVAFKEYIYKLLGLWDDVYWVIPDQPFIEGVTDGIPSSLRDDDHYVIVNTTSSQIDLDKLEDAIGVTAGEIPRGLSPPIELISYSRVSNRSDLRNVDPDILPSNAAREYMRLIDEYDGFPTVDELSNQDLPDSLSVLMGNVIPVEWGYDNVNLENVDNDEKAVVVSGNYVVYHGELGEVYVSDDSVHVRESQWRNTNMVMLREYVTDVVSKLDDSGIVEGVKKI